MINPTFGIGELALRCENAAAQMAFEEPNNAKTLREAAMALRQAATIINTLPEVVERAQAAATVSGTTSALDAVADLAREEASKIRKGERPIRGSADVLEAFADALGKCGSDLIGSTIGVDVGNDNYREVAN